MTKNTYDSGKKINKNASSYKKINLMYRYLQKKHRSMTAWKAPIIGFFNNLQNKLRMYL